MRKTWVAIFAGFLLFGCTDKKAEEKALLDDVLKVHNHVMGTDEQLVKDKMMLDTLVAKSPGATVKDSAKKYSALLDNAESVMDKWMYKFDPDYKGKSHDDVITYLSSQKKQIMAIDTMLDTSVKKSNKYLSNIKSK